MKYWSTSTLILLLLLILDFCQGVPNNTSLIQQQKDKDEDEKTVQEITRELRNLWSWIKVQAGSEDTFVGRCAGAFKKMRMVLTFIVFKLGVIVTTLAFLSIFALKSLGIGVVLLILNSLGLFAKFASLKKDGGHDSGGHGSGQIHLHLHNKPAYSPPIHHHEDEGGWYDRSGHVVTRSPLERLAIIDLYKRLGISHRNSLYGTTNEGIDVYR